MAIRYPIRKILKDKRLLYVKESNTLVNYNTSQKGNLACHPRALLKGVECACKQCNCQITTKGSLAKHKRAVHEGVKYPCGQCNYQATTKGSLAKHKRAVHDGVKYSCRQCGQKFSLDNRSP